MSSSSRRMKESDRQGLLGSCSSGKFGVIFNASSCHPPINKLCIASSPAKSLHNFILLIWMKFISRLIKSAQRWSVAAQSIPRHDFFCPDSSLSAQTTLMSAPWHCAKSQEEWLCVCRVERFSSHQETQRMKTSPENENVTQLENN